VWRKGHLTATVRPLTTSRCNTSEIATRHGTRIAASGSRDVAESLLPASVPVQAASTQTIESHDVIDVAADVSTKKQGGGEEMWVGASGVKEEVATVDEVTIREAKIRIDWDNARVSPSMPALETQLSFMMIWGLTHMKEAAAEP
jgi:hypothetical protein